MVNPIKKSWEWLDDRTGLGDTIGYLALHPVPRDAKWWYVFGSATLIAFVIQVVTGIALATAYVPSTQNAYDSLQYITHEAYFGYFLRGMHAFGAGAMVLIVGLHMAQVFLWGAYKFPREMHWLTGSVLLLLTLAMGLTGQLLRWDQNAIWTIVVVSQGAARVPLVGPLITQFILAGNVVGGATLTRFYAFHVFFIPALIFTFIGAHLFLVIRNGISESPKAGRPVDPKTYRKWYQDMLHREGVPFWPDALWRDTVAGVAVVIVCAILSIVVGPPQLDNPPDPTLIQAYPRPDWYFLWFFAALALLPRGWEAIAVIGGPLLLGILLFALPFVANKGERSPLRRPWSMAIVLIAVLMIGTLWISGERSDWSPILDAKLSPELPASVINSNDTAINHGAQLFHVKGCQSCHNIQGYGGYRGPNLSNVGNRLGEEQLTWRILYGGNNMPAFGRNITPTELKDLIAFLKSRKQAGDAGSS